jgi:butyryl-CoA dehydrogenase
MDFELTDEQELIRNTVREFAEAELAPVAGEVDRNHRFPAEVIPKMAGLGLMGMPWPEKVGGAGADFVSYLIALEEVARGCATTSVIMTAHTTLATSPIFKFGTDAQKDKYLFDMASGRRLLSPARAFP